MKAPIALFIAVTTLMLLLPLTMGRVSANSAQYGVNSVFPDSIFVKGRRLVLGMQEAEVQKLFTGEYRLLKVRTTTPSQWVWEVCEKRALGCFAELYFTKGKLTSAGLDRGPEDATKGVQLAETLYYTIADLVREGRNNCKLDTELLDTEELLAKTASIRCGTRYIHIQITQEKFRTVQSGPSAWIAEGLE